MIELFPRLVLNYILGRNLGLTEGTQFRAERAVLLAGIPRIHEGEYRLLNLEEAAFVYLFTFTYGWDDALTCRMIMMQHRVDAHG